MSETLSIFEFITEYEPGIRLTIFISILLIMSTWEILSPKRQLSVSKAKRWSHNFSLIVLNTLVLRLIFPTAAVGAAAWAAHENIGLLNQDIFVQLSQNLSFEIIILILSVIFMDFVIWTQHLIFHKVPFLWRIHEMHHADLDIDLTTGLRFHPIEILLSMGIKISMIFIFGFSVLAIIIFEIILNTLAVFNHSNIAIKPQIDRVLRKIIVTPDMHRVHHSWLKHETNSNYGFNLSLWDYLFQTYRDQPKEGHEKMTIGTENFREKEWSRIDKMIMIPFIRRKS